MCMTRLGLEPNNKDASPLTNVLNSSVPVKACYDGDVMGNKIMAYQRSQN